MFKYRPGIWVLILLMSISCKSSEKAVVDTENSEFENAIAQLHDFSKLDGCTIMMVTTEGRKLLPQNSMKIAHLAIGQYIRVFYTALVDNASTCMAEDQVVRIESIELLELKDYLPECDPINAPAEKQWLTSAIRRDNLTEVQRYAYYQHKLYWCIEEDGKTTVYDCVGNPLCNINQDKTTKCQNWIDEMVLEFSIYDRSFRK